MTLSAQQRKRFRTIAHNLAPVVTIAQKGLSENVSAELERALTDHELIKIKVFATDRTERQALTEEICSATGAHLVQSIGNVAVLYRAAAKPDPRLSNILRHQHP